MKLFQKDFLYGVSYWLVITEQSVIFKNTAHFFSYRIKNKTLAYILNHISSATMSSRPKSSDKSVSDSVIL